MKRIVMICLIGIFGVKSFAQGGETIREEKESEWVKVGPVEKETANASNSKKKSTAKKTEQKEKPAQTTEQDVFDQTNRQVKRFKKSKTN
jgi:hypothetical protein